MSSLLLLVQDFCDLKGLARPSSLIGSADPTNRGMVAVAQKVADDMRRYNWEGRVKRGTFTSVAAELQGTLATVFGAEFLQLIPGTFWDDSRKLPLFGPVGDTNWQILKNYQGGGPTYQYKIFNGGVYITPTMPAGNTLSFMYKSKYTIETSGGTGLSRWAADTDQPRFPDDVFKMSFEWRWLKDNNEPWSAAFEEAYGLIASAVNDSGAVGTLHLDAPTQGLQPGVWVPAGSWSV